MMTRKFSFTIDRADEGRRMDQFLASRLSGEISRTVLQKLIKTQGIRLNQKTFFKTNHHLQIGDHLELELPQKASGELIGESIPVDVVYEDEDLLVINKAVGMVVHPGAGNLSGTLVHALVGAKKELSDAGGKERPGIVHRLDKDTSGLLLIAKNNQAHACLSSMLSSRLIRKEYAAVVQGQVDYLEGRIEEPIGRDPRHRTKMAVRRDESAREAVTNYVVAERFKYSTLLRVSPVTGRTHQIRVHLRHIGHPVLGDALYGRKSDCHRLALHAAKLELDHPITKKRLVMNAPLPEDFKEILERERQR